MILRLIRRGFLWRTACVTALLFTACQSETVRVEYSHHPAGYWWKLISFRSDTGTCQTGNIAWINASFKTQRDSVFYDSKYDLRDRFFVKVDPGSDNLLKKLISCSAEGDSICALMNTRRFFKEQFKNATPLFCGSDSVVKVYFKIKKVLSPDEYKDVAQNIINNEAGEIEAFFGSAEKMKAARDSMGFYWVQKPAHNNGKDILKGDAVALNYEGSFLNGRKIDISPKNFVLNYGTPDQLIKGLNYVIGRLKIGQISKIILPSQLAFGENGSSNGSIPPYTPMLYEISITEQK
jgi:FKBP-type peptidyl-prolyl cis-trans isomerase